MYSDHGDKTDCLGKNRTQRSLLSHLSQHSFLISPNTHNLEKNNAKDLHNSDFGHNSPFVKESSWSVIVSSVLFILTFSFCPNTILSRTSLLNF